MSGRYLHDLCAFSSLLRAQQQILDYLKQDKIPVQRSQRDWDGTIENIILATLPRSTTMFAQEGRRPSFLWGLSECWYALRVWLMPYLRLFRAITRLFLSSFGLQHFPPAEPGFQWSPLGSGQLFFHSQEEFCMSIIFWSRSCASAQLQTPEQR